MQKIRCFVSIDIEDPALVSNIVNFQVELKKLGINMKLVERENLHITLKFLGEISPTLLKEVTKLLHIIKFQPFNVRIAGVGAFPNIGNARVVWLGVKEGANELTMLQSIIDNNLVKLGFKKEKEYIPHVTIARIKDWSRRGRLRNFLEERTNLEFGEMRVTNFRLKQSILTSRGPIYRTLIEVPAVM
ncbi:MAG: RNA 2',3'-cyclic phosphodiesterase [Thermofilum sp. ex4484_79]|nr:MAG: RNA 2',3'-cyclic phosphodiesterase [Thermofilum sp. ex4484_79]